VEGEIIFQKSENIPVNTEKKVSLLREYLKATGHNSNFETLSAQQLNDIL
jgi:hypothetical protein